MNQPSAAGRRIGLVGLETSHPVAFASRLPDLGYPVTAVYEPDGLSEFKPRPRRSAEDFAAAHSIPQVVVDEATLAESCDVAVLLGTDWDARFTLACRLIDRGLAVMLDKPIAGRVGDLRTLAAMAADGAPLAGGSSLRYAAEATGWRRAHPDAVPSTVLAGTAGHSLYYGVHAMAMALAVLGDGIVAACAEPTDDGLRGLLRHRSGTLITLDIRPVRPGFPYYATVVTNDGVDHLVADPGGLYRPYLSDVLGALSGAGPAATPGWAEPEMSILALAWSARHGCGWVELGAVPDDWAPWSGAEFAAAYRAASSG